MVRLGRMVTPRHDSCQLSGAYTASVKTCRPWKRISCLVLACACCCGATATYYHWRHTSGMTVDEALGLIGDNLDDNQRALVAAALRRQTLAAIRGLRMLAPSTIEAANGLGQIQKELSR